MSLCFIVLFQILRDVWKYQFIWFEERSLDHWPITGGPPSCFSPNSSPLGRKFTFLYLWLLRQTSVLLHGATQTAQVLFNGLQRPRDLELEGILPRSSSLLSCYSIKLPTFRNLKSKIATVSLQVSSVQSLHVKIFYV